ncbi:tyrosine-type recombinase/integrase [Xanthobacter autotrophicus]|uniref:tyrosine-type recombinase/integrase n=1 Tax=Xanthobacter autotrophicus TaxID=280 RepID=UPI0024A75B68|nr:site-specific integrase [Xanthobacter autotrophicus]MDI4655364.1 tyrosine-type recombinase/integrase [Xanthobacter autotrophicus]
MGVIVRVMRKKLTPKLLDSLQAATTKRYEVRDDVVVGLMIRVSATGAKVWYLATTVKDRARRIKLGTYPILSLADARDKAREVLRQIQLGTFDEEPAVRLTLGKVIPQFIELYAKPRNRSWKSTQRVLDKFAALHSTPIDGIKRADVVNVLDGLTTSGLGTGANRALAAIKKLFAWCLDRGSIEVNPVAALKAPAKEVARDRVLTDDEIVACWRAAEGEGFPFEPFAKMVILTGQRRGEVAGMRWSELDLDKGTWTLPAKRTKNATQHVVPLAPLALSILSALPRFAGSDFVFTTTGRTAISGFGRLKARLEKAAGADDWRMHDIRRTVATNMAMMGVQPHVIEAVLNHKSGIVSGVAAVYNRHAYRDEKLAALAKWETHLEQAINKRLQRRPQKTASSTSGAKSKSGAPNSGVLI